MSAIQPSGRRQKKAGSALLLSLAVIGVIMALILFFVLQSAITRSFMNLEDDQIASHLARIDDFKQSSLKSLDARARDWSIWDDTYKFAQDFNTAYVAANLNSQSFKNAQFDGFVIVQKSTGLTKSYAFDRSTGEPDNQLAKELKEQVSSSNLIAQLRGKSAAQSFVSLKGGIYSLAAAEIHRSDGSGDPPGHLAFVQRIDGSHATAALQLPATIDVSQTKSRDAVAKSPSEISIVSPFKDMTGSQVGELRLRANRPLLGAAHDLLGLAFAGVVVIVVAMLSVLHLRFRKLVLSPVEKLHAHIQSIRTSGELRLIEAPKRNDELGTVQDEFNAMAAELQELRALEESRSFALGKEQSAIGLMHNLRNCLSPVRVILDLLENEIAAPLPPQISRALEELASPDTDPGRREKLVEFIVVAHDRLSSRDAASRHSVREAARNLMNAFAAIDAAQQVNSEARFGETCDLGVMLSHAANIVGYSDGVPIEVEINCDPGAIALGSRVLLRQVIENLVTNALEAMRDSGRQDGAISLKATVDRAAGACLITIADNGSGISPEIVPNLFERGFSTRESKSGGLGLHWSCNTIRAMGGDLNLESDGPGLGASARLSLQLAKQAGSTIEPELAA